MRILSIAICLVLVEGQTLSTVVPCERAPPHSQPADKHYRISVAGEPDLFLPGELYTVSLQGIDSGQGPTPFNGFIIWAEVEDDFGGSGKESQTSNTNGSKSFDNSLGTFQAYDAQTKPKEFCKPAVDNATAHPKTEIQVIWSAPSSTVNICVRLSARVGPILGANSWSVLARKLCPSPSASTTISRLPPIVEPCCACDEAKYEVIFEGLWSRNTHPRDFPPQSARAHFGDIIGASHTVQYRVWQEGRVASLGLRRLASNGTTTSLEKELKAESDHIRTIIKARGISWQQVASGGTPSTFAVFRVDAKHHLVSLASKLAPSPDWIVGISALELCNTNCTWTQSATLPLFPYDAGTDEGLTYTASRQPTSPASSVRALRPDWPRDVRSPFFSTSGEMRPFARLRFTRLRLYEKSCDETGGEKISKDTTSGSGSCATTPWEAWSPCSVSCGMGRATRQRRYVWPTRAHHDACRVPLTDHKRCYGPRRHCRAISEYEPDPATSTGPCAVSPWSEWSPCEGCGVRARSRHYLVPRAYKRCHVGFRARTVMSQARPCEAGPCDRPPGLAKNSTNFDWFYVDAPREGECLTSPWSDWSPCSARCGRGHRLRTRLFMAPASQRHLQHYITKQLMSEWNKRFAAFQKLELPSANVTAPDAETESLVQEVMKDCRFTLTQQEALCDGIEGYCFNSTISKDVCTRSISVGHCRGYRERWFYDTARNACEPFGYTGCGGNENNFRTWEDCARICIGNANNSEPTIATERQTEKQTKPKPKPKTKQVLENEVLQNDEPIINDEDVDCETGPWLGWSTCVGTCGYGVNLNYRQVIRPPSGAGKTCPDLLKSKSCESSPCPGPSHNNVSLSSTPDIQTKVK